MCISIRVAAPSGVNVMTCSKAFGSPRCSPFSNAIRSDGTDYQEWISWTEITPPGRIALLHGESRGDPNAFDSVLTFEPDGAATRIVLHTVFRTQELRNEAVEKYHAIEGGRQTLDNLAAYVAEIVRKGAGD